jgi:hypothetical protein
MFRRKVREKERKKGLRKKLEYKCPFQILGTENRLV